MEKIRTQDLSVSIGHKEIIKNISISLEENQFLGIIGPNGSGKSTLLKTIYRVLKPRSGSVFLDGLDLEDMTYRESARKLGVVSQSNQINFDFSVFEMVLLGRAPYKKLLERNTREDLELAERALRRVGLEDYKDRLFTSLSGGEQQRVILARALCQDTDYYILDEPTNHLDIKHQLEILRLMKDMKLPTIMAIHDLNFAANYCDYLYAMKAGRLVGQGRPRDLLTEEFIEELYEVRANIQELGSKIIISYEL